MQLIAVSGERQGDRGIYLGTNGGRPPCNVLWEGFGRSYWVEWHDVEIVPEKGIGVQDIKFKVQYPTKGPLPRDSQIKLPNHPCSVQPFVENI